MTNDDTQGQGQGQGQQGSGDGQNQPNEVTPPEMIIIQDSYDPYKNDIQKRNKE